MTGNKQEHHAVIVVQNEQNKIDMSYTKFTDNDEILRQLKARGRWVVTRLVTVHDEELTLIFEVPQGMRRYGCDKLKTYAKRVKSRVRAQKISDIQKLYTMDLALWRRVIKGTERKKRTNESTRHQD